MTSAHLQGLAWIQSILDWTVSTFTSEATKGYKRYQQLTVAQLTTGLASSASKPVCFTKFTILATLQGLPHVANTDSVALDSCMLASLNAWPCVHWCPWMSIDVMQVMSCSAEMGPRSVDSRWWTSPKQCWRPDGKLEFYTMHLPRDAKSTQPCIRLRVMRRADGRNTGFAHSNRYQLCLHPKGTCHRRQKRRFLFSKLHLEPKRLLFKSCVPRWFMEASSGELLVQSEISAAWDLPMLVQTLQLPCCHVFARQRIDVRQLQLALLLHRSDLVCHLHSSCYTATRVTNYTRMKCADGLMHGIISFLCQDDYGAKHMGADSHAWSRW